MEKIFLEPINERGSIYVIAKEGEETTRILIQEGTGDNLFDEDIRDGYIDYINWYIGEFDEFEFCDNSSGMIMLKELVADKGLENLIQVVLDDIGLNPEAIYIFNC